MSSTLGTDYLASLTFFSAAAKRPRRSSGIKTCSCVVFSSSSTYTIKFFWNLDILWVFWTSDLIYRSSKLCFSCSHRSELVSFLTSFATCWTSLAFFSAAARQSRRSFGFAGILVLQLLFFWAGFPLNFLASFLIHNKTFLRDSVCDITF